MAEEQKPKIIPTILQFIGIIFCGLFTFIGLLYILNGSILTSGLITLVGIGGPFILVHFMAGWKSKKIKNNEGRSGRVSEYFLGTFYIIFFIFLFIIDFHYLSIDFLNRNNIKKSGLEKVEKISNLRDEYQTAIQQKVNSAGLIVKNAAIKFQTLPMGPEKVDAANNITALLGAGTVGFEPNNPNFDAQISAAQSSYENNERAKYRLESRMEAMVDSESVAAKAVFTDWKYFKIGYYYKNLDNIYLQYEQAAKTKMPDFVVTDKIESVYNINDPIKSLQTIPILQLLFFVLILLVVHLFILAPYIAVQRQYKHLKENTSQYDNRGSLT